MPSKIVTRVERPMQLRKADAGKLGLGGQYKVIHGSIIFTPARDGSGTAIVGDVVELDDQDAYNMVQHAVVAPISNRLKHKVAGFVAKLKAEREAATYITA